MISDKEHKGYFNFNEIYGRTSSDYAERTANADCYSCANIQFTSGTTGLPKGAMLSHFNQVNNARVCAVMGELSADTVSCLPLPLYHCFAMVGAQMAGHTVGAKIVYPSPMYSGIATLETLRDEKCNTIYGVPAMFADVCREQA